jgi:DNA helicase-2/ATP-dependent DNA helicase PcrA
VLLHEIALICPTNALCEQATTILRTHEIAAFVRGSEYRLTPATSFIEGCAAWATLGREKSNYQLGALLRRWRSLLGPTRSTADSTALTEVLMNHGERRHQPAAGLIDAALTAGLARALQRPVLAEDATEIRKMRTALETGKLKGLSTAGLAERARKVDRVEVTTMTSSKGLEFDVVLILGMDEKLVPHFASFNDPEKLDEDRRKFYVSVTRARDEVHIFYSGFVTWNNGSSTPTAPSRFLREVGLA